MWAIVSETLFVSWTPLQISQRISGFSCTVTCDVRRGCVLFLILSARRSSAFVRCSSSRSPGRTAKSKDSGSGRVRYSLRQPGAAKSFQVVLHLGGIADRNVGGDPGARDVRLHAAQLGQGGGRRLVSAGHARRSGQPAGRAHRIPRAADPVPPHTPPPALI